MKIAIAVILGGLVLQSGRATNYKGLEIKAGVPAGTRVASVQIDTATIDVSALDKK